MDGFGDVFGLDRFGTGEIRHGVAVFEAIVRSAENGKKEQVG